jgi:hypothetical protein
MLGNCFRTAINMNIEIDQSSGIVESNELPIYLPVFYWKLTKDERPRLSDIKGTGRLRWVIEEAFCRTPAQCMARTTTVVDGQVEDAKGNSQDIQIGQRT